MGTYVEGLYLGELYHFSILISFCMYICLFGAKFFFLEILLRGMELLVYGEKWKEYLPDSMYQLYRELNFTCSVIHLRSIRDAFAIV